MSPTNRPESREPVSTDPVVRRRFPRRVSVPRHAPAWKDRQWSSRVLHRLGEAMAHAATGVWAAHFVIFWALLGLAAGFPGWWSTSLYSATSSVTFVMVFVIQHTQARQTAATQRKLDELIRATARADDSLIAVEEAPDGHLHQLTQDTVVEREWP